MNNTTHDHFREAKEMVEYIDRQKVLDLITELQNFYENERKESDDYGSEMGCLGSINALTAMEDGLSDIPDADVRPVVHGEWVPPNYPVCCAIRCSACGETEYLDEPEQYKDWDFCPHCGADMRGKHDATP